MLIAKLQEKKIAQQNAFLLRKRTVIANRIGNDVLINGVQAINFSSNDYLGLATDPRVVQAFKEGIDLYGFGSSASALVSGYYAAHQAFEEEFAAFVGRESALLFNSGYLANLGVINALATPDTTIISDKLCHASLLDAVKLSKAKHVRYAHNDMVHLQQRLTQAASNPKIIVSESVFSMRGDVANLVKMVELSQQAQALLLIDDAHGVGVLGNYGAGICDEYSVTQQQVPLLITPLGKAFAGSGAVVSGSKELIDALLQFSRTYTYTTALPPAVAHAALTVLSLIKNESWRRKKLMQLIQFFMQAAHERGIPLQANDHTPIKAIAMRDSASALRLQEILNAKGFWIYAIRPPTVPPNTACIRVSLNCMHTPQQIADLLDLMVENYVW